MELVRVDPKEYGLEENQVQTIEQAFLPKIQERDGFAKVYESLITKELTPALCSEASELRKKLVKVRTGIAEIHKTQKAYFLAAGRFVDAWKNKETAPIEQMEEKLSEIEKHFEKIEAERISKLETERKEQVLKFSEVVPGGLGSMDESVFNTYLSGLKLAYESRIKAEQEAEAERLRLIEVEKENARLKAIEDEKIRAENERLKKEAEEKEKQILAERAKAEAEAKKQYELMAKQKAEAEAKQKAIEEQARKEREASETEQRRLLQIEREKQAKLEAELRAKAEAEAAEKRRKENEEKARLKAELKAAKAPDKTKLLKAIESLSIEMPKCSTMEAEFIANEIESKFAGFKIWAEKLIKTL